ncbi:hypothetical protein COO91_05173 [Nostoc flagelliforme CCNUN1]|uniref:Uncharacterized protein n=1 Tax=Nostoc flagelliforme CCNUN1 TaxID=2038116 RepID=A0A2K8SUQ7_9NOSO|nr:hypothetical protein COO91_05173 [Nostoc flagelliforme CCNUN1]
MIINLEYLAFFVLLLDISKIVTFCGKRTSRSFFDTET